MATVKYILQSKSDNAPIYLRLSLGRNHVYKRKTGLYINPKNWSKDKHLPKQTYAEGKKTTSKLRQLQTYILDEVNKANSDGVDITSDWLSFNIDVYFKRVSKTNKSELVIDAINNIVETADVRKNGKGGVGLSKSRKNSYNSLIRILKEFESIRKKKFKIKEVNKQFANEFLKFLLNDKKYSNSYSLKKISDLKTVCYDAESFGIETHAQLKKINSAKGKTDLPIYLTPKELEEIKKVELQSGALINARKWLLLGCNIGQRGGDLINITEENFVIRNGLEVIELTQQKTGKNITIPVLETTKDILDNGLPYRISLQKLNDYIKEVCKITGINELVEGSKIMMLDENGKEIPKTKNGKHVKKGVKRTVKGNYPKYELISSHVCRRTFATNQYGELPTPLIIQITAHSTEKMFLQYIGKNALDYAQQIADFYELQALKKKKEPRLGVIKNASNE